MHRVVAQLITCQALPAGVLHEQGVSAEDQNHASLHPCTLPGPVLPSLAFVCRAVLRRDGCSLPEARGHGWQER